MNGMVCNGKAAIALVFNEEFSSLNIRDNFMEMDKFLEMEESYSVNLIAEGGAKCESSADLTFVYNEEVSETIVFQRDLPNNKVITYTANQVWEE